MDIDSPCTSLGCRRAVCLTMVFTTGCRGIFALTSGAPSLPSFSTGLGVCGAVSVTYSHFSLWVQLHMLRFFFPFQYVIPLALPLSLMAFASGGSVLEPSDIGSVRPRGASSSLSQRAQRSCLCSTLCYQNLATQTQYRMLEGKREPLCMMVWMWTPTWLGDHSSP